MKFRIIKRGDDKFALQQTDVLFNTTWFKVYLSAEDFPEELKENWAESIYYEDYKNDSYSSYELAKKKLDQLIENEKLNKLRKEFKVIEEVEV